MKLIYVAGKYTTGSDIDSAAINRNIEHAELASVRLMGLGHNVFTPHKNFAYYEKYENEDDPDNPFGWQFWMDRCMDMLQRCDAIYMLKGWEDSTGATQEHKYAKELGLEIMYE